MPDRGTVRRGGLDLGALSRVTPDGGCGRRNLACAGNAGNAVSGRLFVCGMQ